MSTQENVGVVKDFFAALGRREKKSLLALSAENIEWIVPGEDWPMAGTYRGHAGLKNALQRANETIEMSYPKPPEFIAQGDRSWLSAPLGEQSKRQVRRSTITGFSTSPFEMAS